MTDEIAAEKPQIVIENLVKRFGERTVLDHINMSIDRGETVVVIGGSGAGKSTLVRHLIALERPTSGQILVDGVNMAALDDYELSKIRRRFGMVFQKYALFDSMSVFDNVAFPLREQTKLAEREIKERVMGKLEDLGVGHAAPRMPSEISGGMAKRVGIARALVMEPEILIYDEPTSGLDPVTSRTVDELIEEMRERFGVTSVVITHDMASAFDIADRVAMLVHGKIAVEGTPETVMASDHEAVRRFVHSSAIDPARVSGRTRKSPHEIREMRLARLAAAGTPVI
ncbi:MAG: ABC transporter ATP-binding protein [Deltaproteobacteria bacterium]|nr:ABC transporter ATP-binding protein [Deltaproteobacteria bacterium]